MGGAEREVDVIERPEVPFLCVVLGYGPMLPLVAGATAAWITRGFWHREAVLLTIIWASAILAFLAGVRRGLSFRTEGGPAFAQIATMLGLFTLALGALVASAHEYALPAVAGLTVGFAIVLAVDPGAAQRGQAPLFFKGLRPFQMAIAVLNLIVLFANMLVRS